MWTILALVTVLWDPVCTGKLPTVLLNNDTKKSENENLKFLGNKNDYIGMDNNSNNIDTNDAVDLQNTNNISDDLLNFETRHSIYLNSIDTSVTTVNYSEHIITKNLKLPKNETSFKYIDQDAQQIQKPFTVDDEISFNLETNNTTPEEQVLIGSEESSKNIDHTDSEHVFSREITDNNKNTYKYIKNRLAVRHILNDYYAVTTPIYEDNTITKIPYRNLETKTHYLKSYDNEYTDTTTDKEYDTTMAENVFLKKNSYLAKHFNLTKTVKTILDYKDMMFDLISRFNASEAHNMLNNDSFSNNLSSINGIIDDKNKTNDETLNYFNLSKIYDVEDDKAKNNDSIPTMGFYILATENFSNNKQIIQEALNTFLKQNFTTSLKRINRKMDNLPDKSDEKVKNCEDCCNELDSDCLLEIKMRKLRAQMFDILLTIEQIKKSLMEKDVLEKQTDIMKDRSRRQGNDAKNESNLIDKNSLSYEIKKLESDNSNTNNTHIYNKDDLIISFKQVFKFLFDDKDFKKFLALKQLNTSQLEYCNNFTNSSGDQSEYDKADYFDTYYNVKILKKTLKTFGNLQQKLFRHILKAVDSIESKIINDLKFSRENQKNLDFLTDGTNYSMDRKRRNISDIHEKAIRYILTLVDALLEEVHSSVISTKNNLSTSITSYTSLPPLTGTSMSTTLPVKETNATVLKPKKTFYSLSPLLLEKNGYTKNDPKIQNMKKIIPQGFKSAPENYLKKREELKNTLTNPLLEKRYTEKHLKKNNNTIGETNISSSNVKMDPVDYSESLPTLTSNIKKNYYPSSTTAVNNSSIKNLNKHTNFNSKLPEENTTNGYKTDTTTTTTTSGPPRYNEYSAFSELSTSGTPSKRLLTPLTLQFTNTSTMQNISPIPIIKIPEKSLFDNYDAFEEKHYTPINNSVSTSEQYLKNSTSSIAIITVVSSESQIQEIRNTSEYSHNTSTRPTKFYFYSNDYEAENKDHQAFENSSMRTLITTPKYYTTQSPMKSMFLNISHANNINLFNDYENVEIDHYDSYNKTVDVTDPTNQDSNDIVQKSEKLNKTYYTSSIRSAFKLFSNYDDHFDIKPVTEETEIRKKFKLDNFIANPEERSVKETTTYNTNFGQAVEVVMAGPPRKTEVYDFINFPYVSKVTDSSRDRLAPIMITNGYHFNSEGLLESATEESETHTVINKILHDKNAALLDALDYSDKETVKPSTTTAEIDRMDFRRIELRGVTASNKLKNIDDKKVFKDPADVALNSDSYFDEVDSDANSNDRDSEPPYPYERDGAFGVAYM